VVVLLLAAWTVPAAGQGFRATGRVVVAGAADSLPLRDAWVVLHEVTMQAGGPRDSMRTDGAGRYRFGVARPDSGALYLVSATYRGVTYFSQAMVPREPRDTVPTLVVFDTSSVAPPIAVAQRHVVVRAAGAGGGRSVLELISLANRGHRTRIAADTTSPVWAGRLPAGVVDFQVGESDVSAEAIARRGDSVVVTAPIPPGEKQIVFTYTLAAGPELVLPVDQPTGRLLVLLEDTTATMESGTLTRRGVQVFQDAQFLLFDGSYPRGGAEVVFRFGRTGGIPTRTVAIAVVGLVALVLLLAVPMLLRRRVVVPVTAETPESLARQIALLDQQFEGGADRGAAAEAKYRERRQALKTRLQAALAARQARP
jgi:hypothetical protein